MSNSDQGAFYDKLCPFCGSDKTGRCKVEADPEDYDRVDCENCGAYADEMHWNNRPQEKRLKDAIDILLRAVSVVPEEQIVRKECIRRAKEAIVQVKKILGVKK